jgi:hypothetical protein
MICFFLLIGWNNACLAADNFNPTIFQLCEEGGLTNNHPSHDCTSDGDDFTPDPADAQMHVTLLIAGYIDAVNCREITMSPHSIWQPPKR